MTTLLDALRSGSLEEYYPTLFTKGITDLASLAKLNLQDYSGLGIVKPDDRMRLARLIQGIRGETDKSEHKPPAPSSADAPRRPHAAAAAPMPLSSSVPASEPARNDPKPRLTVNTNSKAAEEALGMRRQHSGDQQPVPNSPARMLSRTNSNSRPQSPFAGSPALRVERDPRGQRADHHLQDKVDSPILNRNEMPLPIRKNMSGQSVVPAQPLVNAYGVPSTGSSSNSLVNKSAGSGKSPSEFSDRIRVCVRKRPLNRKELKRKETDITAILGRRNLIINEPKTKVDLTKYIEQHSFIFDEVFDETHGNDEVYRRTAKPLVEYTFTGGKATCFVYGQTGSGKTHTMMNPTNGLYLLAARDMFQALKTSTHSHLVAYVSFYEIYQSQLYDLLNGRNRIFAREDGKNQVCIQGLNEQKVESVDQLMATFEYGNASRSTGTTGANDDSSRSHAILQICLRHRSNPKRLHGKFSFIDLAGSERGADRGDADNKTRMEGSEINKSLLALKECIRALDQVSKHTPFRQSKLTQVLKDSFVGNSRTCMIATISPSSGNAENTLNTLRYADRVKEMKADASTAGEEIPEEYEDEVEEETADDEDLENEEPEDDQLDANSESGSDPSGLDLHEEFPPDDLQNLSPAESDDENETLQDDPSPSSADATRGSDYEELVKSHRQFIRDTAEISRIESRILANFTIRLNKAGGRDLVGGRDPQPPTGDKAADFEAYARELDAVLEKKAAAIAEFRARLRAVAAVST
ncbi:P-loop containing nucleoside triphosphate hydrolase protein [Hyaloraphidium curvatum]|nr:P-loop containing nucleoside triphosphate hydrolase protein [Hyaloraphidium curvatum]